MMQPGEYYIGDLCYVMKKEWEEVCDLTILHPTVLSGEFTLKDGRRFAIYSTEFGDGEFTSSTGHQVGVDSGSIGCILVSDISSGTGYNEPRTSSGFFATFTEPFEVNKNTEGTIWFGNINIPTGFLHNMDDEYYGDDEDDEDDEDDSCYGNNEDGDE